MKKIILITISLFMCANVFAESPKKVSEKYINQSKQYRELLEKIDFNYNYIPGDKIKYDVQIKTWIKQHAGDNPKSYPSNVFDIILEEKIEKVSDENINMKVKVLYKNTRSPLFWSGSIYETEGEVFVNLTNKSWIPEISNINTKNRGDYNTIEAVLKKVIASINTPIFFPDKVDKPKFSTSEIDTYVWGIAKLSGGFKANMNSVIRDFESYENYKCAVIDNIIDINLGEGKKGTTIGTVYFDYENRHIIKLDYSGSEEYYDKKEKKLKGIAYTTINAELIK